MKTTTMHRLAALAATLAIALLAGCGKPAETPATPPIAGTRTCDDPHAPRGGGPGPQGCTNTNQCVGICGAGWECWSSDGNCHSHAPGTPFVAAADK